MTDHGSRKRAQSDSFPTQRALRAKPPTKGRHRPYPTTVLFLVLTLIMAMLAPLASAQESNIPPPEAKPDEGRATYNIEVSTKTDRGTSMLLADKGIISGKMYVFITPPDGIKQVRFFLDLPPEELEDPAISAPPFSTDTQAPFDFGGSDSRRRARPYDASKLTDGRHSITAAIDLADGSTQVISADFTVNKGGPALIFQKRELKVRLPSGGSTSEAVDLLTSNDAATDVQLSENASWLSIEPQVLGGDPNAGAAPGTLIVGLNAGSLADGIYRTTITARASGFATAQIPVMLVIGKPQRGRTAQSAELAEADEMATLAAAEDEDVAALADTVCAPLDCSEILIDIPYDLNFSQDHGKILDGDGQGTGFTYLDQPTNNTGYLPANLNLDTSGSGTLQITTTNGIAYTNSNSLDNAIGVGIDAPSQVSIIRTTLLNPPAGTGKFEQAGLWFGNDEDNYVKLIVMSGKNGTVIQFLMEIAGQQAASQNTSTMNLDSSSVALQLAVDPTDRGITASYSINGGNLITITKFTAPAEFFSFDAAGIDPNIGTRSFGGVYATHRNATASTAYTFDGFSVTAGSAPPPPTDLNFSRSNFPFTTPTSMVWGPDNKLYVSELFGTIHRITFDANWDVVTNETITTIGNRLTLGITIDPSSTASNVILWVGHSNPSTNNGELNSSVISRLTGANLENKEDMITGLPRAIANHSINSIHFGPDGKLYIASGGNTGAGGANNADTEFGDRAEQPLSASLLQADVKNPNFDGSCALPDLTSGPAPCDVQVYSSGLRNMYDFVFHSNGSIYGPDNGLGVTGSYPPSPTAPCTGFGDTKLWTNGGDNPGEQPDIFVKLEQGKYYGHPNPYRNGNGWSAECVFKDGSYQGVSPHAHYVPPIHIMGEHTSSDGAIEYTSNAFNNALKGEVLITNYSVGDDITRIKLSSDGQTVVEAKQLVGNLRNPLPLTQGPTGVIFVGEMGANRIAVLVPEDPGTDPPPDPDPELGQWETKQAAPTAILDVGGTALNGKLYAVGGKTTSGPRRTLYIYDPAANSWANGPDLPAAYPAVENPVAVAFNGKLYVFGGSALPFSGATTSAAVYDPGTNAWSMLAPMATGRGGPTAQEIGGKIYVAGGLAANGASLASVEIYDVASNTWSAAADMSTRRDNPGSAALGGKFYVFGGRTRNADGSTINGTLNTVEMYDPATNTWTAKAPMPTGRRTMVVGTLNGRAQVMGGEITSNGGTFVANEEYDPVTNTWRSLAPMVTPRHGAAAGTINNVVYVAMGGPSGGTSFSSVNEAFSFGDTGGTVPDGPTGLTATAINDDQIDLAWSDNADDETAFTVERSLNQTDWTVVTDTLPADSTSYSDTGLDPETTYFYRVTATNATGSSTPSNIASDTTDPPPATVPADPTGLTANASSDDQIDLSWTDNADNETAYTVERSLNQTDWTVVTDTLPADSTNYSDTGLDPETLYHYRIKASNAVGDSSYSNIASDTTNSAGGGGGVPLPGRIEVEDYKAGGEGVGYHDTSPGNNGGQYRQDDVDIQTVSDTSGAFNVGWIDTGEWLAYDVEVAETGSYRFIVRVATPNNGKSFHIEVDGVDVTGPVSVPNTGNFQNWTNVAISGVQLTAGSHELRVVMDATQFNLNYIIVEEDTTGSSVPLPGLIEAEDYKAGGEGVGYHDTTPGNNGGAYRSDDVDIETTADSSGAFNVGWIEAGEWLAYDVDVASAGSYRITVRVATPRNNRMFHIEMDGVNVTGSKTIPNTGGFQNWTDVVIDSVQLTAGTHELRFVMETMQFNLNFITVEPMP